MRKLGLAWATKDRSGWIAMAGSPAPLATSGKGQKQTNVQALIRVRLSPLSRH